MIKNYFKIALRNLWKFKGFSLINIFGLSMGLACFVLIAMYVADELSYDRYNEKVDRIFRINSDIRFGGTDLNMAVSADPMGAVLKKDYPQVEEYARLYSSSGSRLIKKGDEYINEDRITYADSTFLKVFTMPVLAGDSKNFLNEPNTVAITETIARKYFGDVQGAIGKTIETSGANPTLFKVTTVLADMPHNSHFIYDFLFSMANVDYDFGNFLSHNFHTYVLLKPGTDYQLFNKNFDQVINKYILPQAKQYMQIESMEDFAKSGNMLKYSLFPIKDIHLHSSRTVELGVNGNIQYVYIFSAVALFILLIACINFMNLSTAQATQRAKEVGVRKAIGASRYSLIKQFMAESVFLALLAGALAILLVQLVLPGFNSFLRKDISIDLGDLQQMFYYGCIILITGIIAGSYPALVLSAFRPIAVLKSAFVQATVSTGMIRKSLVVTQFVVSIMLIISTLLISQQIDFIKKKNLGFNVNQLVWFPNNIPLEKCGLAMEQMKRIPGVAHAAQASVTFSMANNRTSDVGWPGKAEGNDVFFNLIASSHELVETMGLTIKEGRSFSQKFAQDTGAFILNEEAVIKMGLVDPIGKTISTPGGSGKIVGIVKDFHMESLHNPISPVLITCRPDWTWLMYCRLSGNDVQSTLKEIESVYHQFAPGFIFDFNFQDKEYERLYRSETQVGTLVKWFAGFAIFISCLGLLGLTLFTIERKAKEIGIRKVLGATLNNITNMLTSEFLGLIFISLMIASPVAYYLMTKWLGGFAYRIDIEWWIFALAGSITIGISVFTILIQAVKAAMANPVKALRSE